MRRVELATALLLACASLSSTWAASPVQAGATSDIKGKVNSPAAASTYVILYTSTGQKHVSYVASDGSFAFTDVPVGTHLLQPFYTGVYFPEVQVELGKTGVYRAQYIIQAQQAQSVVQPAPVPLSLRPVGEMLYYEKRKPVDVWSFVKSPYGLMIVFSLFIIVVLPRLKVDPEELKQLQAELKGNNDGGAARSGGGASSGGQQVANR